MAEQRFHVSASIAQARSYAIDQEMLPPHWNHEAAPYIGRLLAAASVLGHLLHATAIIGAFYITFFKQLARQDVIVVRAPYAYLP